MRQMRLAAAAALLVAGWQPAAAADGDAAIGIWRNTQNSVHIEARHCGASMCGKVVWANAKAIADARRGGTANLVGTDLFRDFRKDKKGQWRGKVFVPDINKTFSGTVVLIDANTAKGSGCLVGRVGCRSQTLTRIK